MGVVQLQELLEQEWERVFVPQLKKGYIEETFELFFEKISAQEKQLDPAALHYFKTNILSALTIATERYAEQVRKKGDLKALHALYLIERVAHLPHWSFPEGVLQMIRSSLHLDTLQQQLVTAQREALSADKKAEERVEGLNQLAKLYMAFPCGRFKEIYEQTIDAMHDACFVVPRDYARAQWHQKGEELGRFLEKHLREIQRSDLTGKALELRQGLIVMHVLPSLEIFSLDTLDAIKSHLQALDAACQMDPRYPMTPAKFMEEMKQGKIQGIDLAAQRLADQILDPTKAIKERAQALLHLREVAEWIVTGEVALILEKTLAEIVREFGVKAPTLDISNELDRLASIKGMREGLCSLSGRPLDEQTELCDQVLRSSAAVCTLGIKQLLPSQKTPPTGEQIQAMRLLHAHQEMDQEKYFFEIALVRDYRSDNLENYLKLLCDQLGARTHLLPLLEARMSELAKHIKKLSVKQTFKTIVRQQNETIEQLRAQLETLENPLSEGNRIAKTALEQQLREMISIQGLLEEQLGKPVVSSEALEIQHQITEELLHKRRELEEEWMKFRMLQQYVLSALLEKARLAGYLFIASFIGSTQDLLTHLRSHLKEAIFEPAASSLGPLEMIQEGIMGEFSTALSHPPPFFL